jgi:hypothetical protein
VNVTEGHIPEKVLCSAVAYPEATYQWKHDTGTFIRKGNNALILSSPVSRAEGGNYTCEASNRHGKVTQKTFINVLCKYMMLYFSKGVNDIAQNCKNSCILTRMEKP